MTSEWSDETGGRAPAPGALGIVQAFINTLDLEIGKDALTDAETLRSWLVNRGLLPEGVSLDDTDLARALALREAIRLLLLANTGEPAPPEAATTLNQLAATATMTARFETAGDASLEPAGAGLDAAIARLFGTIVTAMQRGEWTRLKACREHTCQWAFYDASKNHSGTWCVMSVCGNRNKVRAYQQRRRAATKQT